MRVKRKAIDNLMANATSQYADPVASTEAGNKVLDLMHADFVTKPNAEQRNQFSVATYKAGDEGTRLWKPATEIYVKHLNGAVTIMLAASLDSFTGSVSTKLKAHLESTMRVDIAVNLEIEDHAMAQAYAAEARLNAHAQHQVHGHFFMSRAVFPRKRGGKAGRP